MKENYSQLRAMMAITKASLIAMFKSPQSIFFSLFFPIVLIVIFGSLGRSGTATVDVALEKNIDTTNSLYHSLIHHPLLDIAAGTDAEIEDQLRKGRITAMLGIDSTTNQNAHYEIHLRTTTASQKDVPLLESILRDFIHQEEKKAFAGRESLAVISREVVSGRRYQMIDFFLPGMIGFSLIGAAIFGVAFSFFAFRETLVLKRLYSTPVSRTFIVIGEGLSRVIFQLTTVIFLIAFGYFVYDFTLANGLVTAINMLVLSFIGLIVFMGFGFLISGMAKNQTVIPIYANLFMFPQYFLSGTFFPKTALPQSIQSIIKFLPLTAVNDAMRNVAFEGAGILSCWPELLTLAVWAIIVYALAVKFFKWE